MKIQLSHKFEDIVSVDNLLEAWEEFRKGKRKRRDVQEFGLDLMSNIILLHNDLAAKIYKHFFYTAFRVFDPKPRDIHKAGVRDRLLHHAVYRILYPFFARTFIADSYSCQLDKGTHKAINRFRMFASKVSKNHTKTAWVLKCDIKKFFASINQEILLKMIEEYIPDQDIKWLISQIVSGFYSTESGKGLPLGNLTSQLFVNIYMNKFDQFVKHNLKAKYYIRYSDDFVILSQDKNWLELILVEINKFLLNNLKLQLHPNKISITTVASGVDYLGWVNFPDHRVLRTTTKKRMFRNIRIKKGKLETVHSYLGLLGHGNTINLQRNVLEVLKETK